MTVSANSAKVAYSGNGSNKTFAITFPMPSSFSSSEIEVYIRDGAGTQTLKSNPTDYSISGLNVVFVTAPASGTAVHIRRKLLLTQSADFVDNDPFPAQTQEDSLDRATLLAQDNAEKLLRTLTFKETSPSSNLNLPEPVTDSVLAWDTAGVKNLTASQLMTAGGAMLKSNNLSDVANTASARTNLGLGTAATQPSTAFEPANANIQSHIASTSNPHGTTATQVPVTPSGNLASTTVQAALVEHQGDIDTNTANIATNTTNIATNASAISSHTSNTSNPHNVTAAQVGNTTAQWNANKIQSKTVDLSSIGDQKVLTYDLASDKFIMAAGSGGGSGITAYANSAALPTGVADGTAAITKDNDTLYIYNSGISQWKQVASPTSSANALSATSSNSVGTLVARDVSGNFSAGTITATFVGNVTGNVTGSLSGNATTATTATNFSGSLSGDVTGTQGATTVGKLNGVTLSGLATGILKNTTGTGAPSIAVAADFPTLNQNTTGSAASFTGSLSGDVTGTQGATAISATTVTGKAITGFVSGAGTVAATDTILQAINKLDGNTAAKLTSPLTTKGDILAYSTTNSRLPVGSNGQRLIADSQATFGFRWTPEPWQTKNYLAPWADWENNSFGTGYWSTKNVATTAGSGPTSTTFNGSNANMVPSIVTGASAISGSYSAQIAWSAATTVGDMFVNIANVTIDPSDQGKILRWRFAYKCASGASNANWSGTTANSFAVWIYDVTNNVWIQPEGCFSMTQSSGVGTASGSFQVPSNMASFRFAILNLNATAGAITLVIDDLYVGPGLAAITGPAMTDDVAYTPTITGFGTAASVKFTSRRVGNRLVVNGYFVTGTPTAVAASVTLGHNGTNANVTTDSSLTQYTAVGKFSVQNSSSPNTGGGVVLFNPNSNTLSFGLEGVGNTPTNVANGNALDNTGGRIFTFHAEVPIQGWSSNVSLSSDTDTRIVAARYTSTATTGISGSATTLPWATKDFDTHSMMNTSTGVATVYVPGYYRVTHKMQISANALTTSQTLYSTLYKNGSAYCHLGATWGNGAGVDTSVLGTTVVYCNAGDTLAVAGVCSAAANLNGSATGNWIVIERISGPATVAASEKVYLQYTGNASTVLTANTTNIDWSTKVIDSHAAWSGSVFTAPRPMMAIVQGAVNISSATTSNYYIYVNGTQKGILNPGTLSNNAKAISGSVYLNAGDTLSIRSDSSVTLSNSATLHWLSIMSQG